MSGCIRRPEELPSKSAKRFIFTDSECMILTGTRPNDKEYQQMNMVLFENERLDENSNNAIKTQLVTRSKQHNKYLSEQNLKLSFEDRDNLVNKFDELAKTTDAEIRLRIQEDLSKSISERGTQETRLLFSATDQ